MVQFTLTAQGGTRSIQLQPKSSTQALGLSTVSAQAAARNCSRRCASMPKKKCLSLGHEVEVLQQHQVLGALTGWHG